MTQKELDLCLNFSKKEIEATGAKIDDIDFNSFHKLQYFRRSINRRVKFQLNGITSGNHSSEEHKEGKAFDIYFDKRDGIVDFGKAKRYIYAAVVEGFTGIGLYYNGKMYSLHLDCGEKIRRWIAGKKEGEKNWKYFSFVNDPKKEIA